MVVFCLIVFDSILIDFYKFFEFIGIILQKILEEKIIRTQTMSSYYFLGVQNDAAFELKR